MVQLQLGFPGHFGRPLFRFVQLDGLSSRQVGQVGQQHNQLEGN